MALVLHALAPVDLDVLVEGPRRATALAPQSLKDVHHQMARLFAMGLRTGQVAERIGYTFNRVSTIRNSPAFEALIQGYRSKLDASFTAASYDFFATVTDSTIKAERMLNDRLSEAIEGTEGAPHFSNKELLAIRGDGADRIGYGKRQTKINLNADFAAMLDKAVGRSREAMRTIEVEAQAQAPPKLLRRA